MAQTQSTANVGNSAASMDSAGTSLSFDGTEPEDLDKVPGPSNLPRMAHASRAHENLANGDDKGVVAEETVCSK